MAHRHGKPPNRSRLRWGTLEHIATSEHERLICLLLAKTRRARYRQQLARDGGKLRAKFVDGLNHTLEVDQRFATKVPADHAVGEGPWILAELRRRGAPESCYLISSNSDLDRHTMFLDDAFESVYAMQMGTLISCIAGKLAYYESEEPGERYILHRPS